MVRTSNDRPDDGLKESTVGDKGGKKDKAKGDRQAAEKKRQDAKRKQDKQPKKKAE